MHLLATVLSLFLAVPGDPVPRQVEILAPDGHRLHATYYPGANPGPALIFFRNCEGTRADLDAFALRVSAQGMHAVTWDYRVGTAPGLDWRATRLRDAQAVAAWLLAQDGADGKRLVAIGGSCGVSLALDFTMQHGAPLRGLVLLSGPSLPEQRAFVARTPHLAIFGGASRVEGAAVPYIDSVVTASANPANRLVVPEDAGHGTRMLTQTPTFADAVLDWLAEQLR